MLRSLLIIANPYIYVYKALVRKHRYGGDRYE